MKKSDPSQKNSTLDLEKVAADPEKAGIEPVTVATSPEEVSTEPGEVSDSQEKLPLSRKKYRRSRKFGVQARKSHPRQEIVEQVAAGNIHIQTSCIQNINDTHNLLLLPINKIKRKQHCSLKNKSGNIQMLNIQKNNDRGYLLPIKMNPKSDDKVTTKDEVVIHPLKIPKSIRIDCILM